MNRIIFFSSKATRVILYFLIVSLPIICAVPMIIDFSAVVLILTIVLLPPIEFIIFIFIRRRLVLNENSKTLTLIEFAKEEIKAKDILEVICDYENRGIIEIVAPNNKIRTIGYTTFEISNINKNTNLKAEILKWVDENTNIQDTKTISD